MTDDSYINRRGYVVYKKNTSIEKVIKGMKEKIILVEEYIQGNDYTVALMNGKILGVLEIIPKQSFYNFSAKYRSEKTIYKYPKKTPPEMIKCKEVDLYNILLDFDSSNIKNSSLKDALKMLWNKYKSEFKSIDL